MWKKMKLPNRASNVDVKNVRVCPNQTIPGGVAAHQRGVETQKYHSCMWSYIEKLTILAVE